MLLDDRCDCECHEEGRHIVHIMPCCYRCGVCHNRVDAMAYHKHTKVCAERHQKVLQELQDRMSGECKHNWVLDGHNCGEPICSKCFKRE